MIHAIGPTKDQKATNSNISNIISKIVLSILKQVQADS